MTSNVLVKNNIGFSKKSLNSEYGITNELLSRINKCINYNSIDNDAAKKYLKRETVGLKLTKDEIEKLILDANVEKNGIRGLQKELNKYKISKLLTKV